jgi:EpsI family protein
MTASRIKAVVVFLLMAVAFGAATAWKPTTHLADQRAKIDLETLFPRSFGEWVVDDRMPVQLVSPDQAAVLNAIYNQTLSRTYVNRKGERIMLSVAYGGDQSDATRAHWPEVCYPAQGFQIISSGKSVTVLGDSSSIATRQLVAQVGGRVEPITYWVTIGTKVATNGTEQKLSQLSYSVAGLIPDGMLVRVSSIDRDRERAYRVHDEFLAAMYKAITGEQKPRIFGESPQ